MPYGNQNSRKGQEKPRNCNGFAEKIYLVYLDRQKEKRTQYMVDK